MSAQWLDNVLDRPLWQLNIRINLRGTTQKPERPTRAAPSNRNIVEQHRSFYIFSSNHIRKVKCKK